MIHALNLTLFSIAWAAAIYAYDCLLARQWIRIEPKLMLLYFTTVAMIGIFGEIFLDTAYNFFVGQPLWYYNILPIHGGYTSSFAIVTWGIYGAHLYLLHGNLAARWSITRTRHLALIFCFEALILEALLTLSAKVVFGEYLYYYLPGDLWHVTSVQNIPFYFICGVVILKSLKRFKSDPIFFSGMATFLTLVMVFFV